MNREWSAWLTWLATAMNGLLERWDKTNELLLRLVQAVEKR